MPDYPLVVDNGHLFVELEGRRFVVDTGSPASFGHGAVRVGERPFDLAPAFMGLDAGLLSTLVERPLDGLVGADILNVYDVVIDVPAGRLSLSNDELTCAGERLPIKLHLSVPILSVRIDGLPTRMFFDTGAHTSYYQDDTLHDFPSLGPVDDFYPGFGAFTTETYRTPIQLGSRLFHLRCGRLPDLLGPMLTAHTDGIMGNEILRDRVFGYFPRRGCVVAG